MWLVLCYVQIDLVNVASSSFQLLVDLGIGSKYHSRSKIYLYMYPRTDAVPLVEMLLD